ncbi:hypothetical protein CA13_28020 [Planctomycetes bacterium CA13]|uniref:Uncharacterized protein n=1 Tax=Novipirellula herctigrandis TaxID=2527986 RepID=A0A5C5Z2E4_9BACT|nr:hypothetical protein CA13_28020 [Planctomycetes bacterium CA13]
MRRRVFWRLPRLRLNEEHGRRMTACSMPTRDRDRLIVPREDPEKYTELDVEIEKDAIYCKHDLAFLF